MALLANVEIYLNSEHTELMKPYFKDFFYVEYFLLWSGVSGIKNYTGGGVGSLENSVLFSVSCYTL